MQPPVAESLPDLVRNRPGVAGLGCPAHHVGEVVRSVEHRSTLVRGGNLLRHAHAPRVDEQLAQFVDVDGVEPHTANPAPATTSPGQRLAGQGFYRVKRFFYRAFYRPFRFVAL